jgi:polar amino acid transport system substrate-binding protein
MKSKRAETFCTLITAVLIALFLNACAKKSAENELRVGMELAYPPFEMTDEHGQPTGVSVDLARTLGEALHRKVMIQNIPFDGLIFSLKTGKIDLILSSMTATPERAESIDFSEPYATTGLALLVSAKSPVQSIKDLESGPHTITVKKGTTGDVYARAHLPSAVVHALDDESACVVEVVQGKADAFIYDQLSTLANWEQNPTTTKPLLTAFKREQWAIGIRKGNSDLQRQVNAFLAAYRAEGGFDRLGERWLSKQKAAFEKLGVPFVF